jgi:asparagine synthase (glutamine-hydrolysing)
MPFPFSPGLTEPRIIDLTDPADDLLIGASREDLTRAIRAGDVDRLASIGGSWAGFAQEGVTIRLARTIGRPLRYFVAKRETGPYLIVADRIDAISDYCRREEISWQFHPSYTRVVPAHHVTELDQVGCPDPNPRYRRFFSPSPGTASADVGALGRAYTAAISESVAAILGQIDPAEPIGVALSGGADSSLVAAVLLSRLSERGERDRLRFYTLSIGGGPDSADARRVADALGVGADLEIVEAAREDADLAAAVACLEDYGAVARAFFKNLRALRPGLRVVFDGDGGDENWKAYPVEDSDLTIKSVLNNPLLYHEGWGVDSIKHSLTYSGGLSRGVVRGFAPAREFGFRLLSPHAMRPAIEAALSAPLRGLVGDSLEKLYAVKGDVVRAGLKSMGLEVPFASKRRFQDGAASPEIAAGFKAGRAALRKWHEDRFTGLADVGPRGRAGETSAATTAGPSVSAPM